MKKTLENNVISTFDDFIMIHSVATYKVSNDWGHLQFIIISSSSITIVPINTFQRPKNNNYEDDHKAFKLIWLDDYPASAFWNFCYNGENSVLMNKANYMWFITVVCQG